MPEFKPSESKTAKVTMRNPTGKSFDYDGFIYMGTDLAVVSEKAFSLGAGEERQVSFPPVTMPTQAGTYPVHIGVFSEGKNIALYRATEDVVILAPPAFAYASDIRREPWYPPRTGPGYKFEVDIQNIGGAPGTCHPTAHIRHCYGHDYPDMGTKVINPGEVVTFYGQWHWPWEEIEPGEWWDLISIRSEAHVISFAYGRQLQFLSYEPTEVGAGVEFIPAMTLLLPYRSGFAYMCRLLMGKTTVISVDIGAPDFTYNPLDLVMYTSGTYTLTGINRSLTPGTYDVTTRVTGCDNYGWPSFIFYDDLVGKVEVI